jgi:two-component system response regulator DegU
VEEIIIAIIDRSEFFRAGVHQALSTQRSFRLMDCSPDQEPLKFIEAHSVDIALLDIDYPTSKGLELGRSVVRYYPNTRVIIMSPYHNDDELFEVIRSGAAAYIDKRVDTEELVSVIKRVSQGEYPINDSMNESPAVADRVLRQFQEITSIGMAMEKVAAPLTNREIQILNHIANGSRNKQIAHILGISEQTIKNHVSAVLRKLNANDRAHAVALAVHNQWVSVDAELSNLLE